MSIVMDVIVYGTPPLWYRRRAKRGSTDLIKNFGKNCHTELGNHWLGKFWSLTQTAPWLFLHPA